jgi:hypothetical protein
MCKISKLITSLLLITELCVTMEKSKQNQFWNGFSIYEYVSGEKYIRGSQSKRKLSLRLTT